MEIHRNEEGLIHRDDGPAVKTQNGDMLWYQNGVLHRIGGPAIERVNGEWGYFVNGARHRLGGLPAIGMRNGDREWWEYNQLIRAERPSIYSFSHSQDECPVCYRLDKLVQLNLCGHTYCQECIDLWLAKNRSCPYCRCILSND